MRRKFFSNLLLLLLLNILIKPFWIFGIDRTVQNLLGDQQYGMYFALFNFSMLLNIILDIGITNFNNRNIAQHNYLISKHLSNIVSLKFMLAIVYAIFTIVLALIIGYNDVQLHLLAFLIFNQFLISFTFYLRSNISGLHHFKTDSFISVLDRTLMIIICSVLLFTPQLSEKFTIQWFVYSQTAAYLITTIITFYLVLQYTDKIKIKFNPKFFRVYLRQSYPYALLILLMSFYNRIDSVLLERILPEAFGKEQAGVYAQAFRLLDAVSMFGVLFAGLLMPIFAKMIKDRENISSMVYFSYSLIIAPGIILAISSVFYNDEIMSLLYHTNTHQSALVLQLLMIGGMGIFTTYIFGTLLTANGSMKQLNMMASIGMILNIILNILLIPRLYAVGSAYASMITQLFTAIVQVWLAYKILQIEIDRKFIYRLVSFLMATIFLGYLTQQIDNWVYGYLTMLIVSIGVAFLLKMIDLRELFNLLKQKDSE